MAGSRPTTSPPRTLDLSVAPKPLVAGTPEENAKITLAILNGEKGHKRNAVLMNAGAALYIGGKAETMKDGVALAAALSTRAK